MYKKILVPISGSEHSRSVLKKAIDLARGCGTEVKLTVLHVNQFLPLSEGANDLDFVAAMEDEGRSIVRSIESLFDEVPFSHDSLSINGDPASLIERKANEEQYDLIVIGGPRRGLLVNLLFGSISHRVARHSRCPVLLFPSSPDGR
jgi:nucleotide-binding universal stress UspA family protein